MSNDELLRVEICRLQEEITALRGGKMSNTKSLLTDEERRELIKRQAAEIEQLRAENELLKDRSDEHHRIFEPLRAEIERLHAALKNCRQLREAEYDRFTIEIERLRDELHYANGVAELAMKHRDAAEALLAAVDDKTQIKEDWF